MYPIALALVPSFDTFCNVINVVRVPSVVGWVRDEVLKALVAFEVINADLEAILTVPPEIERTPFQRTMFVGCNVGLPWTTHGLLAMAMRWVWRLNASTLPSPTSAYLHSVSGGESP